LPATPPSPAVGGTSRDAAASPASFSELIEESEKKIGRAVIDGATESLRRAAKGSNGDGRDGTVERR
jgi:hypothetical protein